MMKNKLQEILKKQDEFYYNRFCNEIFTNNSSLSEFTNYYDRNKFNIEIIIDKFKNKESFYFCKNLENKNGFFNYISNKKIFLDIVIYYSGNNKYTINIDKDEFYKIKCCLEKNKILKEVKTEEKTIIKKRRI